jgi:3-dehydroquinate dehydratase
MSEVLVLVPRSVAAPQLPEGALLVPFQTCVDAVVSLRATSAPCVLVTDGLDTEDLDTLAAALRDRAAPCVEVRSAAWDGETHSPVSGVCRGVISGFGPNGIRRAVELLSGP